jgi:hypothetical protein
MQDNQTGDFAAKVCADYSVMDGGVLYGDWYLPSKYELNLMYLQKSAIGNFASFYYRSSTEYDGTTIWGQNFSDGTQGYYNKIGNADKVRAIRSF